MPACIGEYVSIVFLANWEHKHRTGCVACEMVHRRVELRVCRCFGEVDRAALHNCLADNRAAVSGDDDLMHTIHVDG